MKTVDPVFSEILSIANAMLKDGKEETHKYTFELMSNATNHKLGAYKDITILEQEYLKGSDNFILSSLMHNISTAFTDYQKEINLNEAVNLQALISACCYLYLFSDNKPNLSTSMNSLTFIKREKEALDLDSLLHHFIGKGFVSSEQFRTADEFVNALWQTLDYLSKYLNNLCNRYVTPDLRPTVCFKIWYRPSEGFTVYYATPRIKLLKEETALRK